MSAERQKEDLLQSAQKKLVETGEKERSIHFSFLVLFSLFVFSLFLTGPVVRTVNLRIIRLKALLIQKLVESGWMDDMKEHIKGLRKPQRMNLPASEA